MKGIVLCAGAGTRLRPLTHTGAKHLIPVANKAILFYAIEALVDAGVTDLGIVVGATGWQISDAVGDGERFGCRVTYIPQERPLGLGHAVRVARDFVGDSRFVVYLGDNFIHGGIGQFVSDFAQARSAGQILLSPEADPSRYGVAQVDGDRILRLIEKPKDPPSNLCIVGVYAFGPEIFESIERTPPSARGEVEITDAIQGLIDAGLEVRKYEIESWWKDTGKPEDVLDLNRRLLEELEPGVYGDVNAESVIEGRVHIEEGAMVRRSHLRGPVIIAEGCEIEGSYIGPYTSIGPRTRIVNSDIEYSILLSECVVEDATERIDSSLLGNQVVVSRRDRLPARYKFVLADQSQAELP